MESSAIPQHIGFIMDGNGRWAKKRSMPRNFGHSKGAEVFKKTINWCRELGVKCATFYAFSTENWKRPPDEIKGIMDLLRRYIKDIRETARENIRIIILGDIKALDEDIQAELLDIMDSTKENDGFIVGIALNYGGRAELCRAVMLISEKCASGELNAENIDEKLVEEYLYTSEMPPLDMIIRPSGEQRLSNFLLWQAAYSELVFMDVLWPDFSKKDLISAIDEYAGRSRRYGGV